MKHAIATGTDVAMVCFFDPAALPAEFDGRAKLETLELFNDLEKEGRIWYMETGSDGGFLFHFYVEEEIPDPIARQTSEPQTTERFMVPSGTLWVCGAEYAARDPQPRLERFNHMGGEFKVSPGDYTLTTWRAEWPEGMEEQELEKRLGKAHGRINHRLGVAVGMLFIGSLIATFIAGSKTLSALGGPLKPSLLWLWGGVLVAWAICVPAMRKLTQMEKDPRRKAVMMEFPSIVVQMRRMT